MENKEFDEFIKRIVDQEDIPYNESSWNRLSQLLHEKEDSNIVPFVAESKKAKSWKNVIGIAAAIALLLGATIVFTHYSSKNSQIQNPILAEHNTSTENNTPQNIEDNSTAASEDSNNNSNSSALLKNPAIAKKETLQNKDAQSSSNQKTKFSSHTDEATNTFISKEITKVDAKESSKKNNADTDFANLPTEKFVTKDETQGKALQPSKTESSHALTKVNSKYFDELDLPSNRSKVVSTLSFGGGVNYSTLNTGYALSLGAKQKISKNLYFDGSVSVLYNNNVNNGGNFAGKGLNLKSKISPNSPGFSSWKNVLYVQLNPSIGYQVIENLGLSVGGDIQQMLSNDNNFEKIQFTDNGIKVFPIIDVGFTTKAEFDVGENIQTGIIYRQGVNNLFKSEDALPFINRRYIQVQFKYNLPIKRKN